jgi:hypothetical protein
MTTTTRRCAACGTEMGEQITRIAGAPGSNDGAFRLVCYCPNPSCPAIVAGMTPGYVTIATPTGDVTEDEWDAMTITERQTACRDAADRPPVS